LGPSQQLIYGNDTDDNSSYFKRLDDDYPMSAINYNYQDNGARNGNNDD